MHRFIHGQNKIAAFAREWLLCFAVFVTATAYAQTSYHISTGNGLSTNNLTAVIRAKNNYMWTASYNGLNKHEGSAIRVFNRLGKDDGALSNAEIHTIFEDNKGFIWLGTTGGVDRLDPRTNRINHYRLRAGDKHSSYLGYVYSIFQDKQNRVWISTDVALFQMDAITEEYREVAISRMDGNGIPSPVISYKGSISTNKGVWMSTNEGLVFYEYSSGQYYHRYHNPKNLPVFSAGRRQGLPVASELCEDSNSNLYFISSSAQLIKYNLETSRLDSFSFSLPANAWKCCYSITSDHHDNIWMGFRHGGLIFFDAANKQFIPIVSNGNNSLIGSNYIYSLAEDYLGKMWVTTDNGVDVIDWYDRSVLQTYLSNDPNFVKLNFPSGMMSYDGNRYLYIPFFKGGLFRYDTRNNSSQHFSVKDTSQQHVSYVDIRNDGSTWFGNSRTLSKAELVDTTIRYNRKPDLLAERLSATNTSVTAIMRDNKGGVYSKKVNGSIYYFNGVDSLEKIKGYGFMKQVCLSADSQHLLYIGHGMNVMRRQFQSSSTDTIPIAGKLESTGFHYFNPRDIAQDVNGNIWIASQNGLIRYDEKRDSIEVYTSAQGLSSNFCYALCTDRKNRVWVASLGGIDWFDGKSNVFRNVVRTAGATYMDSYGSSIVTAEGTVFFLAGNKLLRIEPDRYFSRPSLNRELSLHELQIGGVGIDIPTGGKPISFSYNQNRLSFRFGLLDFGGANDARYYYQLKGVDKNWIENTGQSVVSYNALRPGRFVLQVKATDASGNLVIGEQAISFHIRAPFWETLWFRAGVALLIAGIIYSLYQYRQRKQREKELQRLLIAESRFLNLRLQMNPHFLFNSLNSIQHLVVTQQHEKAYRYLTLFSHLLRSVLQYAERDFISLDTELEMLRMYLDLEAMRFKDSFRYEIIIDESLDQEEVMVPSLLVQPFAENAIWHGLLNKEGDKRLTISFSNSDECLTCRVIDNGIGREKAAALKQQQVDIPLNESKGIEIIKERLGLLEQRTGKKSGIKITDMYSGTEGKQPSGTMVEINIPFYYSEEHDQSINS